MIDTHTHIYLPDFDFENQPENSYEGQCAAVDRAIRAGVDIMVFPNVDIAGIEHMRAVHALRPEATRMAMGLHPTEVGAGYESDLKAIKTEFQIHPHDYVAVGEVGIDLYWDKTYEKAQMLAFDSQTALAVELGLPVIIHCREGLPQVLEILQGHPEAKAVFHSFGGSAYDVEAIRRLGDYFFGINGIVTFKNSRLGDVLPQIGINRILTETDSPYLAPVPHRGKRNESAYIPLIAACIARHLGIEAAQAADICADNARQFFSL